SRERVAEIVRKAPEKVRGIFDGLRLPTAGVDVPEPAAQNRKVAEDPETELRRARTRALIRHARAVDDIFTTQDAGERWSPAQTRELGAARDAFEEVRPHGWRDAEAAYKKNPELAREAGSGQVRRAVQALQLETELRTDPQRRADRFVARWQELGQTSQHQYKVGDMSGYKATRSAMGDMAKSLERDPQLESILANRKRELGISFDSGRSLGRELAFTHGIDLGRGRGIGI
ncbi:MAG: Ti-type conjugative transfer relaxase TraA, partial [Alphaproteobacteria bacterium]|nr:Ti-type conjugative transfer relaxase TraA [Alphaproteobacteria bacterium]